MTCANTMRRLTENSLRFFPILSDMPASGKARNKITARLSIIPMPHWFIGNAEVRMGRCSANTQWINALKIPPIGQLHHQRAVANRKRLREVIVSVDNEQIGCRAVPPLKARIQIHIFLLFIVLRKSREV